jgi:xanthine/CO dehydrogenase XdhC/CoxF family maturation factor
MGRAGELPIVLAQHLLASRPLVRGARNASVRRALAPGLEIDDADQAERLLCNLGRRLDQEAPGIAAVSILAGLDEMLTSTASGYQRRSGAGSPAPTRSRI